jgi:hypothetical protein
MTRVKKPTIGRVVLFHDYKVSDRDLPAIVIEVTDHPRENEDPLCVRLFVLGTESGAMYTWALHVTASPSRGWDWPPIGPDAFVEVPDESEVR